MLLKKSGHIIMIFLLLASVVGVNINKHYSGGKLFSTAIFVEADSCCETPCGCCDESSEQIKLEADYLATSFDLTQAAQLDLLFSILPSLVYFENTQLITNNSIFEDTSPPPLPDLYILNQVFRL